MLMSIGGEAAQSLDSSRCDNVLDPDPATWGPPCVPVQKDLDLKLSQAPRGSLESTFIFQYVSGGQQWI